MYVLVLFLGTVAMCLSLTPQVEEKLMENLTHFSSTCKLLNVGEKCELLVGYMAVYRIAITLSGFFFLMSLTTVGLRTSRGWRANFHNGSWIWKFLILIGFNIGIMCIPSEKIEHFQLVWMYIALVGGVVFILIQVWLLIFFSRSFGNKITHKIAEGGNRCCWFGVSSTCTMLCYSIATLGTLVLFNLFTSWNGCASNKIFIGINAFLCVLLSVVSALTCCGPKETHSALLQAGIVSVYITYLTWTAVSSVPREQAPKPEALKHPEHSQDDKKLPAYFSEQEYYCGPADLELNELILPYVGVAIMFLTVVYSSIGTSSDNAIALGIKVNPNQRDATSGTEDFRFRDSPRVPVQRGGQPVIRNEWDGTVYNYSLFHVVFCLASMYIMMSFTAWLRPEETNLTRFNQNWPTVWIKMGTSWACVLLYLATLPVRRFGRYSNRITDSARPAPIVTREIYERETVT